MAYRYFLNLVMDAAEAVSEEQFIGEIGFPAEINLDAGNFTKAMHIIYSAAHGDFKGLVKDYKLTNISRSFGIPYRTLLHWTNSDRSAPEYVTRMVAFAIVCDLEDKSDGDI